MKSLISNPPYNMKWNYPDFASFQERFSNCELPPESNANYAFILTALDMIDNKAVFLLPCGVLSTSNKQEINVRSYLVEKNLIESVIILPDNMFESTSIPTCVIVFNKKKETTFISMVDMRNTYDIEKRKQKGQYGGASHENRIYEKEVKVFSEKNIDDVIEAIKSKKSVKWFCKQVSINEVKENSYILTPGRYIEIEEEKSASRPFKDIVNDLNRVINEKNACKLTLNETLAKSIGFDIELYKKDQTESFKELNDLLINLGADKIIKHDYFRTTKNKNEIKFENNSKDILSSILMIVLNNWKHHLYYLNTEENRYLAELRDALLPKLMNGEIKI